MEPTRILFSDGSISELISIQMEKLLQRYLSIHQDEVNEQHIAEFIENNFIQKIHLYDDSKTITQGETTINQGATIPLYTRAVFYAVCIPFSGSYELWYYRPNTYSMRFPEGVITPPTNDSLGSVTLYLRFMSLNPPDSEIQRLYAEQLHLINSYLSNQLSALDKGKQQLRQKLIASIQMRMENAKRLNHVHNLLK